MKGCSENGRTVAIRFRCAPKAQSAAQFACRMGLRSRGEQQSRHNRCYQQLQGGACRRDPCTTAANPFYPSRRTDEKTVHHCNLCHAFGSRRVRPAAKCRRAGDSAAKAEVSGDLRRRESHVPPQRPEGRRSAGPQYDGRLGRLARGRRRGNEEGRPGCLVGHHRPAEARVLHLYVPGGWRAGGRSRQFDDLARWFGL